MLALVDYSLAEVFAADAVVRLEIAAAVEFLPLLLPLMALAVTMMMLMTVVGLLII